MSLAAGVGLALLAGYVLLIVTARRRLNRDRAGYRTRRPVRRIKRKPEPDDGP